MGKNGKKREKTGIMCNFCNYELGEYDARCECVGPDDALIDFYLFEQYREEKDRLGLDEDGQKCLDASLEVLSNAIGSMYAIDDLDVSRWSNAQILANIKEFIARRWGCSKTQEAREIVREHFEDYDWENENYWLATIADADKLRGKERLEEFNRLCHDMVENINFTNE